MFGLWKRKKPVVHKHWYAVLPEFETSTSEFYDGIQQHLETQRVPGLFVERIEYAEGGLLSAKRIYLRMRRERLVFDVCSAPFGTYWFFSCRFSEIPFTLRIWELLLVLLILAVVEGFYVSLFGLVTGSVLFGSSVLGVAVLMRNLVAMGLTDLDSALMQLPVIGAIYEVLFRKETYYREDTRLAYIDIVDKLVREKIDETVGAKGVQMVEYKDASPPSHPAVLSMIGDLLRIAH